MNTVAEVYAVCINAAHNEKKVMRYSSAEKLIQDKCYQIAKTVTEKEKNYFMMKKQCTD